MISDILTYLVKVFIGSSIMFLCFHVFFKKDTFYVRNRMLLLLVILLPLLIPVFDFGAIFSLPEEGKAYIVDSSSIIATSYYVESGITNTIQKISFIEILFLIYITGLLVLIVKDIIGVNSIRSIIRQGRSFKKEGARLTVTESDLPPLSFLRDIIISKKLYQDNKFENIIIHELAHIRQKHYIDLLISELFLAIQWFNPFAWMIRKAIKENHEYLADNEIAGACSDVKEYQLQLLTVCGIGKEISLANNFNKRIIKNRIAMMNKRKTKSIARLKDIFLIPAIIILLLTITASSYTVITKKQKKSPFSEVSQAGIMDYVKRNITYPRFAALADVQGEVYVALKISRGEIRELNVYSSPGDLKYPIIDEVIINAFPPDAESLNNEKGHEEYIMQLKKEGKRIGEQIIGLDVTEFKSRSVEFAFKLDFRLTPNVASIVNVRHASGSNNLRRSDIEAIKEGRKPLNILNGKIVSLDEFKKSNYKRYTGYNLSYSWGGKFENPLYGEKSKDGYNIRFTEDAIDGRSLKEYLKEYDSGKKTHLFVFGTKILTRDDLNNYDIESKFTKVMFIVRGKDATDLFGDKGKNGVVYLNMLRPPQK